MPWSQSQKECAWKSCLKLPGMYSPSSLFDGRSSLSSIDACTMSTLACMQGTCVAFTPNCCLPSLSSIYWLGCWRPFIGFQPEVGLVSTLNLQHLVPSCVLRTDRSSANFYLGVVQCSVMLPCIYAGLLLNICVYIATHEWWCNYEKWLGVVGF